MFLNQEELNCNHAVVLLKKEERLLAVYELKEGKYRAKRVWK